MYSCYISAPPRHPINNALSYLNLLVYAPLFANTLHELIIKLRLVDARLELVEVVESKLVAVDFAVVSAVKELLLRL